MEKNLTEAITTIDRQFGAGSVMLMSDKPVQDIPVISTRWYSLDKALGVGGLPRGRITEIFGPESSGKTTLALQVVAEAQASGGMCAYVDAEHAIDMAYASKLNVKVDQLLVSQPDYGEQALEISEALIASGAVDVLVVDSVAALVPKAELEGEMGDSHMGLHARLMSQALRKLAGVVAKTNTVLIMINQIRDKIGVMFGSPETTTGGRALKFYASIRLDIRRIQAIKEDQVTVGFRTRAKVVKNKVSPPATEAEGDLMFGKGISLAADILDVAVSRGIVSKSGSWYNMGSERLGHGRNEAIELLEGSPNILNDIRSKL